MKRIILIMLIITSTILNNSCAANKSDSLKSSAQNSFELKTISKKGVKLKYPTSWVKSVPNGRIILAPKKLKELNPEDEFNNISVNKNVIYVEGHESIGKTLELHCNTLLRGMAKKDYKIIKLPKDDRFICKVESLIEYTDVKEEYKRVEYFYAINGKLDYIQAQMRTDLFEVYEDEILLIINSIELKK